MRVLMFGWEFPPYISGGLGTACYGLTQGMANNGIDVTFIVPKLFDKNAHDHLKMVGADEVRLSLTDEEKESFWEKVKKIGIRSYLVPYHTPESFNEFTASYKSMSSTIKRSVFDPNFSFSGKYGKDLIEEVARYAIVAGSLANNEAHDVIHVHDWMTFPAGIEAKKMSNKPLFVHVHATEFDRSGEHPNPQVFDIEKRGMEGATQVITVSDRTRDTVINKYGISPNKVKTVHNAIQPKRGIEIKKKIDQNKEEKIVTFLGRVTYQKGPDYFIEVASKVLEKTENVRFVMAGSGDMLEKMILLTANKRIGSKFHFTGFLQGEEVSKMYKMSDVYVMPSVSEPFGISPLEAMQENVPVIISKQSGVSEVLKHAIKIDFWNVDAMANAIYALIKYKGLSDLFIKKGKSDLSSLKWDAAASKIKILYETHL